MPVKLEQWRVTLSPRNEDDTPLIEHLETIRADVSSDADALREAIRDSIALRQKFGSRQQVENMVDLGKKFDDIVKHIVKTNNG